jgi:hypothetical protein
MQQQSSKIVLYPLMNTKKDVKKVRRRKGTCGLESRTMEIILYELKASRRKNGCWFLMVIAKGEGSHCTFLVQVETSGYNSSHFGRNLKELFPRYLSDHANRNVD